MVPDMFTGIFHIPGEHLPQLVYPFISFRFICADQSVHAHHIHLIVMAQGRFLLYPVSQPRIVDDMIAAHQACQIKCFGRRVKRRRALSGILADHLGWNMLISFQRQIRPDLVGDHIDVVFSAQFHKTFQFPALPHAPAGIMRRAENGGMDAVLYDFFLHIGKIHTPDIFRIQLQRTVNRMIPVIFQAHGKSHIGRRMKQHLVSFGTQYIQRAEHATEHAILISDVLCFQSAHSVAIFLPPDDGVKIFLRGAEVAVRRVRGPLCQRFRDGRHGGKIHIRHPHGNDGKTVLRRLRGKSRILAQTVHRYGILAAAVHNRCEIVFHKNNTSTIEDPVT